MFNSEMTKSPDRQTDTWTQPFIVKDENHNIHIAMSSSSRTDTDSVLAGGI